MVQEFDILLDPEQTIQIGSNTKLFTAVGTAHIAHPAILLL